MRSVFYQFIQTPFAQNKRFAVLLLLMMNVAWIYAGDSYFRAKVDVKADPTGVGTVYVSRTSGEKTSQTAFGEYGKDGKYDHQTTFYFMADHENAEYLWYAWIANNKPVLREKNGSLTFDCSEAKRTEYGAGSNVTDKQSGNDSWDHFPFTFTANWVQPDVTGLTGGTADGTRQSTYTLPTITNPTPTNASLIFTLSNDYAGLKDISDAEPANFYSIATALNTNGYTNGALTHTKGSGSLTVPITYTPTGVHGQTNSASLTVKSNYPSSGANYWMTVLNVTENYKPSYTLDVSSYNFTPTQPISNSGSESYTLPISNRNYAANNVSEWEFVWSSVTYAGGTYPNASPYSIDDSEINNPKVIITAPATGNYMDVTATLTIVAKYKDAGGNLISSEPKTITFSADIGNVLTINDVSEYTMDFGTVDFGTEYTDEVKFVSTYADLTETVSNSVEGITFTTNALDNKIVVNIANTTNGEKILYDIDPIRKVEEGIESPSTSTHKVEQAIESATSTTNNSILQNNKKSQDLVLNKEQTFVNGNDSSRRMVTNTYISKDSKRLMKKKLAEEKYSIINMDTGKSYVQASRQVIRGNSVADWRSQISEFFNKSLKNSSPNRLLSFSLTLS